MEIIRSVIRPVIALGLLVMVGWLVYQGTIEPKEIMTFFGVIVGFYFGERAALKQPGNGH
jgi:hypothetical protein